MSQINWKFSHVHVLASDVPATERWFVDGMGAELVQRRTARGAPAVDLLLGGVAVYVRGQQPDESLGPAGPSRFGTDHIGLEVNDLYATAAELKRRGVEFEVEPFQAGPTTHMAFVKGPDAVRIEILQRN